MGLDAADTISRVNRMCSRDRRRAIVAGTQWVERVVESESHQIHRGQIMKDF